MIRIIEKKDFEIINEIGKSIKNDFNQYYDIENNYDKEYSKVYVYDDDGIKGFIYIEDHYDYIDLIAIAVKESVYKNNIGSMLIEYVIKTNPDKRIILEVRENNLKAIKLYEKYNFKEINRRKKYYSGIDAIIMERK